MRNVLILPSDAYRMVDALRDYADILEAEASLTLASHARTVAKRIENGQRHYPGNLITVEQFDLDSAHSAVIGVMIRRYEAAQELKDEAARLDAEAKRLESFLEGFTA